MDVFSDDVYEPGNVKISDVPFWRCEDCQRTWSNADTMSFVCHKCGSTHERIRLEPLEKLPDDALLCMVKIVRVNSELISLTATPLQWTSTWMPSLSEWTSSARACRCRTTTQRARRLFILNPQTPRYRAYGEGGPGRRYCRADGAGRSIVLWG